MCVPPGTHNLDEVIVSGAGAAQRQAASESVSKRGDLNTSPCPARPAGDRRPKYSSQMI